MRTTLTIMAVAATVLLVPVKASAFGFGGMERGGGGFGMSHGGMGGMARMGRGPSGMSGLDRGGMNRSNFGEAMNRSEFHASTFGRTESPGRLDMGDRSSGIRSHFADADRSNVHNLDRHGLSGNFAPSFDRESSSRPQFSANSEELTDGRARANVDIARPDAPFAGKPDRAGGDVHNGQQRFHDLLGGAHDSVVDSGDNTSIHVWVRGDGQTGVSLHDWNAGRVMHFVEDKNGDLHLIPGKPVDKKKVVKPSFAKLYDPDANTTTTRTWDGNGGHADVVVPGNTLGDP